MARTIRIVVSFVVVLVVYLTYAAVAVPLIEPAADEPGSVASAGRSVGQSSRESSRWRKGLAELLPPDMWPYDKWPLEKAKILASRQFHLVFWSYSTKSGGRVEISPCVIVYAPEEAGESLESSLRRAVVLDAPDGAMLEFDGLPDLTNMTIGRLKAGRLNGRVTVRSKGKRPGPEDDLMIVTNTVELTESRVWTTHPVMFRLGANHGRGHQMEIKLLGSDESAGGKTHAPDVVGVESFEIHRLEQLHLEFGSGRSPARGGASPSVQPVPITTDLPIEISSQGPFRFEPMRQQLTIEDRVNVLQLHPDGPSDQIQCDTLTVFLARPRAGVERPGGPAKADATQTRAGAWDLQPRRIEARGNPVVVSAQSEGVEVRGERLDYDFESRRIVLDGSEPVFLKQQNNEIHARNLQYQPGQGDSLGQVVAGGPGRLVGQMDGAEPKRFQAVWGEQLQIRPIDGQQVISLTGGAEADYVGMGGLAAREIHFWLTETPAKAPGERKELRPDSMLATGDVKLRAAQLGGQVQHVEVWFEQGKEQPAESPAATQPVNAVSRGDSPYPDTAVLPAGFNGPLEPIRRDKPVDAVSQVASMLQPRFEIVGKLMRARMLVQGRQSQLSELIIEGDVRLAERYTEKPDELPLLVTGDRIRMVDAMQPHAAVMITGAPAHFEGRGLGVSSSNINLNRGTNRLWIDGPGEMDLPMRQGLEGEPLATPGSLGVQWNERMTFDGTTASFEGTVVATGPSQTVRTETLEVGLKTPVRFDQPPKGGPEVAPEQVRCRGGVILESESLDSSGRTSLERMELADLEINLSSGQTLAHGPGWMTTVRRGLGQMMTVPGAVRPVSQSPTETNDESKQLSYLSVRFRGSILGNVHQREMTFGDQVRAVYGPVDSWDVRFDSENLDSLGPRGVMLSCDSLKVAQMPEPRQDRPAVEMEAAGSVRVEGQTFTARAARMTYAEAKDLLLLEGDGRTDAQLFYQRVIGAPYAETTAQQIWYWPSIPKVQFHGAKSFEWSQIPSGTPAKGK